MESWLPAIFGFGGVLVGSFFSLWLTKLQLNHADKSFDRELLKAREDAQRQRRREIRGEPLQKLRSQLGVMVAKSERVVKYATLERSRLLASKAGETLQGGWGDELRSALRDVNGGYIDSEEIDQALSMVEDEAIRNGFRQLNEMLFRAYDSALRFEVAMSIEILHESPVFNGQIEAKVREIQELINKQLEEL